jgi:hypothetical protein
MNLRHKLNNLLTSRRRPSSHAGRGGVGVQLEVRMQQVVVAQVCRYVMSHQTF